MYSDSHYNGIILASFYAFCVLYCSIFWQHKILSKFFREYGRKKLCSQNFHEKITFTALCSQRHFQKNGLGKFFQKKKIGHLFLSKKKILKKVSQQNLLP